MKKLDKYNEYCVLVSRLDSKAEELKKVSNQKSRLTYEVDSLKKELQGIEKSIELNPDSLSSLKRLRMKHCLSRVAHFEEGGSVTGSPIAEFKKSSDFKDLSKEQKKLFKKVESILSETQYSLQNAVLIGQDDDEDFDVYDSAVIEDYIDESMESISDYDEISVKNLKELKQIMYKFVERVSKM